MNSKKPAADWTVSVSANSSATAGKLARGIEVEVYRDFETCSAMREEWDSFVETVNGEIFLTYDWCRIWWKHYGKARKLLILVFRCQGEMVGLLPVFHERIWLWPFFVSAIKIVGTDFTPITVNIPIKQEFLKEVLHRFRMLTEKEWKWDIIRFGSIAGMYRSTSELVDAVRGAFADSYVETKEEDLQTYLHLQTDWDAYLKSLSSKQRTNARRAFRDIEARKVDVASCVVDAKNLNESFDEFVQMHQTYWCSFSKPGHFKAWPEAYEFHREEAEINAKRNRLRLLKITFNGKCVAYEYFYKTGKTYFWFINGRSGDLYKSGFDFKWIALRAKLELAATEGVTCIDSMRGGYDYKVLLGGEQLPIRSVQVFPSVGLRAMRVRCFCILARAIDIAYAKIWRRRLAPRLHYRVGPFWKTWIRSHVLSI